MAEEIDESDNHDALMKWLNASMRVEMSDGRILKGN